MWLLLLLNRPINLYVSHPALQRLLFGYTGTAVVTFIYPLLLVREGWSVR